MNMHFEKKNYIHELLIGARCVKVPVACVKKIHLQIHHWGEKYIDNTNSLVANGP